MWDCGCWGERESEEEEDKGVILNGGGRRRERDTHGLSQPPTNKFCFRLLVATFQTKIVNFRMHLDERKTRILKKNNSW